MTTTRRAAADFVTGFSTGWPEDKPELMILSLSTAHGVQDFAFTKDQAVLVARTIKQTAAKLAAPKR